MADDFDPRECSRPELEAKAVFFFKRFRSMQALCLKQRAIVLAYDAINGSSYTEVVVKLSEALTECERLQGIEKAFEGMKELYEQAEAELTDVQPVLEEQRELEGVTR